MGARSPCNEDTTIMARELWALYRLQGQRRRRTRANSGLEVLPQSCFIPKAMACVNKGASETRVCS
jgi:hypothetical protein